MKKSLIIILSALILALGISYINFNSEQATNDKQVYAFDSSSYVVDYEVGGRSVAVSLSIKNDVDKIKYIEIGEGNSFKQMDGEGSHRKHIITGLDYNAKYSNYAIKIKYLDGEETKEIIEELSFKTKEFSRDDYYISPMGLTDTLTYTYNLEDNISKDQFRDNVINSFNEMINSDAIKFRIEDAITGDVYYKKITEALKNQNIIAEAIKAAIDNQNEWDSNTKITLDELNYNFEIDLDGEIVVINQPLKVNIYGYKTPDIFNLVYLIEFAFVFLGVDIETNIIKTDFEATLRGVSAEGVKFIELIHNYLTIIAMALFVMFLMKRLIDRYTDNQKLTPKEVIRIILMIVFVKLLIDNSLFIAETIYNFHALLLKGVYQIKLSDLGVESKSLVSTEKFKDIFNINGLSLNDSSKAINEIFNMLINAIIAIATIVLYLKLIIQLFIIIMKRYFFILIIVSVSPLAIATMTDNKTAIVGKNAIKQFFIKLFHGLIIGVGVYLIVILGLTMTDLVDELFLKNDIRGLDGTLNTITKGVFSVAVTVLLGKLLSELDEFTGKLF